MHLYTNLAPRQLIMQIVYAFAYQFGPVTINHADCVCICIPIWPYGS